MFFFLSLSLLNVFHWNLLSKCQMATGGYYNLIDSKHYQRRTCLQNIGAGLYANRCFFVVLDLATLLRSGLRCQLFYCHWSGVAEKFERMVNDAHESCEAAVRRSRWEWESTSDRLWAPFLFAVVTDRLTDEVRRRCVMRGGSRCGKI